MYSNHTSLVLAGIVACGLLNGHALADIILAFDGAALDTIASGADFSTSDRLTGTIIFDDFVGPTTTSAKSFTLSTTVGGGAGFTFNVVDAGSDARVTLNTFQFGAGSLTPTVFNLSVAGNAFSGPDLEELSISNIGDLASVDIGAVGESSAFNFTVGSFSAVPEPSALALSVLAVTVVCSFARGRRE